MLCKYKTNIYRMYLFRVFRYPTPIQSVVRNSSTTIQKLGVKIRNLKVDFKTGGSRHLASGRVMNTDNEYL